MGHSALINPAIHAVRGDLADVELAELVFAPHYARAMPIKVVTATTVHEKPNRDSVQVDKLLPGAAVDLFDLSAGWGWIRTEKAIGYVRADCIVPA